MLRHYVAIALRNIARSKLYATISVTGLAIGFGAAALVGLYVHDELTYDRWLPSHERIYMVTAGLATGGQLSGTAPSDVGHWLVSDYPQLEAVTRFFLDGGFMADADNPDRKFNEVITWADRSTFDVFKFPVLAGALEGALDKPDSLVLTRGTARKYFGTETAAVGKTLLYNGTQPMVVTAVIANLPSNANLGFIGILAAAHAPFSQAAQQELAPISVFGGKLWNSRTFVLLRAGVAVAPFRESLATLIDRHAPMNAGTRKASEIWLLGARPLSALHLSTGAAATPDGQSYGAVYTVAAIGLLILLTASINFVNILTAVGVRRALEVGVRKALGAQRRDLFTQFMSESFLYVAIGAVVGFGIAALALRPLNTFLNRRIDFSMFLDWRVAAASVAFLAATALLAGVYPAVVLSSFRPATVTKGGRAGGGQAFVRQALVVLQFSILIALLISTAVTYRQMRLGVREGLRMTTDPVVIMNGECNDALKGAMLRAPGVREAACSMGVPQLGMGFISPMQRRDREAVGMGYLPVDYGFFELYGLELAAGRLFAPELGTDASPPDNVWNRPESVVVNETGVRALGFGSAEEAVGQTVSFMHMFRQPATFAPRHDATIIGVLRDFQMGPLRDAITPAAFYVDPGNFRVLSLKLDGRATPEALDAIDRIWSEYAGPAPARRIFYDRSVQNMYLDLQRQTTLFTVFAGIAVLIAVLGLVGLAAHAAVSRTREIGIRKTLGGGRWAITRLLLWQFARPVLIANVIAWPVGFWAMSSWLSGFATRVELVWWVFVGAGAVTLVVAVAAVLVHTWGMAGTRPVAALRYE
ncbi:MAG TPA: FtsX-like permease family protein [Gammaproteobacteria bacterium]|nr:FtsX-like permease family protein [Gammaproteobacteria bacterium]